MHDARRFRIAGLASFLLLLCMPGMAKAVQIVFSDPVAGVEREFSLDDMRKMPVMEISTSTPWTDGVQHFVRVALTEFLYYANIGIRPIQSAATIR